MYVKKFEGETLDEVLRAVKGELGPDAIILKTITNKGLKGAFKKARIEITAAISEQNYEKKARVDHVLTSEQKSKFYSEPATAINESIKNYNEHNAKSKSGYGAMGLNKVVNSVSKASNKLKSGLDDFLSYSEEEEQDDYSDENLLNDAYAELQQTRTATHSAPAANPINSTREFVASNSASSEIALELRHQLKTQQNQIELLEKKLFELTQNLTVKENHNDENRGIRELRTTLKTLDLSDKVVGDIIKKAKFELNKEDLDDADVVYDFALRELNNSIKTAMPLFSSANVQDKAVVTVLLSETSSGQSSMAMKLAVLQENVKIIKFRKNTADHAATDFTSKIFNLEITNVDNLAHLMSEIRKTISENKSLILDIKLNSSDKDETRKIIETLKRSIEHIEFLVTVSAINSEIYNRKILSKYKDFADGVIISYMDQCLNFGSLLNVHYAYSNLPFKFFGTGATVPDDIEAATSERILAGMFEF